MEEDTIDEMEKLEITLIKLDEYFMKIEDLCHVLKGDIFQHNFTSKVNYPINLKRL